MSTQAHAETVPRRRSRPVSEVVTSAIGLGLVGIVVVWLVVNLFEDWSTFLQLTFSGLTRGSIYALVALGYTLVYGILELINFAHGDVFMIGGMLTITFANHFFGLHRGQGAVTILIVVAVLFLAMASCGFLNASIEFIAYKPLRHAPRLAPLITAMGVSFIIQNVALAIWGPNYVVAPDVLPRSDIFHLGGFDYQLNKGIALIITVPVLL